MGDFVNIQGSTHIWDGAVFCRANKGLCLVGELRSIHAASIDVLCPGVWVGAKFGVRLNKWNQYEI